MSIFGFLKNKVILNLERSKIKNSLKDFSLDKLNTLLDKAIADEDYEKAARIRDEINKRN